MAVLNFRASAPAATPSPIGGANRGQWGLVTAFGSSTGLFGSGMAADSVTVSDSTSSAVFTEHGVALRSVSAAGQRASWTPSSFNDQLVLAANPFGRIKFAMNQLTDVRYWAGFSSASGDATVVNDLPNVDSYFGFTFSPTTRGDTFLSFWSADAALSAPDQTTVASDVAPTTDVIYVEIDATASLLTFRVYDESYTQLGSDTTISTNLPAGDPLQPCMGVEDQAAAGKSYDFYFFEWACRPLGAGV